MALLSTPAFTERNFLCHSGSHKHLIMKALIRSKLFFYLGRNTLFWSLAVFLSGQEYTQPAQQQQQKKNEQKKPVLKSLYEYNIKNKHVLTKCRVTVPMATISLTAHVSK